MDLINERLKYALKERGLSVNKLAERIGMPRSVLFGTVSGEVVKDVNEQFINRVSEVIQVDAKWLCGLNDVYTTRQNQSLSFKDLKSLVENREQTKRINYPERLRCCLLERGMNHIQLAQAIGVYREATLLHLRGKDFPNEKTLLKTANALNVEPDWLNGYTDSYTTTQGEIIGFNELANRVNRGLYDVVVEERIEDLVDREVFAEALKSYIELRGFKQMDLAIESGVYQSIISNYLSGKTIPHISTLIKLANALGIDPVVMAGKKREGDLER